MGCRMPLNNQYVQKTSAYEFSNLNCNFEGFRKRILAVNVRRAAKGTNSCDIP
jgi:hypothetical protein